MMSMDKRQLPAHHVFLLPRRIKQRLKLCALLGMDEAIRRVASASRFLSFLAPVIHCGAGFRACRDHSFPHFARIVMRIRCCHLRVDGFQVFIHPPFQRRRLGGYPLCQITLLAKVFRQIVEP
jgi:hypothetical protein